MGSLHTKKLEFFPSWRLCAGTRKERTGTFKTKSSFHQFMIARIISSNYKMLHQQLKFLRVKNCRGFLYGSI